MISRLQRLASLLFILATVAACQPISLPLNAPGDSTIRPARTTNEITQSHLNLAVEYIRQGDHEGALEALNRARQADPAYPAVYNAYGILYQQIGQPARAEESFKRAIGLDNNDSPTLNNYGRLLCQQGRAAEAEKTFLRAAKNPLYQTPEIALTNAGLCLDSQGRAQEAEAYYRQALQLNPEIPQALLQMCEIILNKNDHLAARGFLQRYQQVARHTSRSLWLGVQIENELGDKDAVSSYALLLRNAFPDSAEAGLLSRSGIR